MKSYPVILVLGLIQIPNTVKEALAVLIGFTDMFISLAMVSGEGFAEITKFAIITIISFLVIVPIAHILF